METALFLSYVKIGSSRFQKSGGNHSVHFLNDKNIVHLLQEGYNKTFPFLEEWEIMSFSFRKKNSLVSSLVRNAFPPLCKKTN